MTAAVYRSGTPSLSVPETQNTAPVLEFNCMYTHDVRRKQKRWQDGFLRFHTFNKRIMVYDVPRNFIGDVHWKAEGVLQDGDEVTLERDGILVQVAESLGSTDTDLTELRRSKKKTSSEVGSSSPMRAAAGPLAPAPKRTTSKPTTQLKHRSLNALLGTPKGPIGKAALPLKSPFEERNSNAENEEWSTDRPAKRMRMHEPPLWNITCTTTTPKPSPAQKTASRNVPPVAAKNKKAPLDAGQQKLGTRELIDLSVDDNDSEKFMAGFSSEALGPPSSPQKPQLPPKKTIPVRSSSPVFQTQKVAEKAPQKTTGTKSASSGAEKTGEPKPQHRLKDTKKVTSTGVVKRCDRPAQPLPVVKRPVDPLNGYLTQPPKDNAEQADDSLTMKRPDSKQGKTLRMNATAPKNKTLLCQEQGVKKPSRIHSVNTENAIDTLLDVASQQSPPKKPKAVSQRRQLDDRLARIGKKSGDKRSKDDASVASDIEQRTTKSFVQRIEKPRPPPPDVDAAEELARLDQLIMPPTQAPSPSPMQEAPTAPPESVERQLRRVVSETSKACAVATKRKPGDPVRYTPSPAKKFLPSEEQKESAPNGLPQSKPLPALPPKTRAKTALQRSVSLNTAPNGTSTVILGRPFQAPKAPVMKPAVPEKAPDPWSREAFDLFTWRPPNWDEEKWCLKAGDDAIEVSV